MVLIRRLLDILITVLNAIWYLHNKDVNIAAYHSQNSLQHDVGIYVLVI